ncbi:MAG: hypothetical protein J5772_03330 [Clostridia bacterium]|nr:hypothetical protein [Clostridia bacterium]
MSLVWSLIISLALTEAIELPLLFALGFRGKELIIAALANVVTNPPLVFTYSVLTAFTHLPAWSVILPLELAAVLAEALIYKKATARRLPLLDSLIANAVSYSIGLVITTFIL